MIFESNFFSLAKMLPKDKNSDLLFIWTSFLYLQAVDFKKPVYEQAFKHLVQFMKWQICL